MSSSKSFQQKDIPPMQHQQQQQQQQHLPLHAHLQPEDVRVAPLNPYILDIGVSPSMNTTLQSSVVLPNPGPFGLCAFALTAFSMGLYNLRAGVESHTPGNFITGTAMLYGGLGQVIAGLLEFRNGNTFGGTTFCSYGLYWVGFAASLIPNFGVVDAYRDYPNEYLVLQGIVGMGWTIFTFLMWSLTWRSNIATTTMFFCLGMSYLLGAIANLAQFDPGNGVTKAGGCFGVVTASIAWYCAMSDLANTQNSYYSLPLGQFGPR